MAINISPDLAKPKLTLGPLMFNWPSEKWRDFYFRIADEAPVDSVYIGEVVCSKRVPFIEPYLPDVIERLQAAGKEVVLSSLALVMTERELDQVHGITATGDFLVEANDVSSASLLAGRPHVIGPLVNVYNEGTLEFFARLGAKRVCLSVELSAPTLSVMAGKARELGQEIEVIVFGRLPLALSARCYHARAHNLHKDGCEFICGEDLDGMELETLDGTSFLAVNGTQTMSYTCCNLLIELTDMRNMGINCFRLSPQNVDMVAVSQVFRNVLDDRLDIAEASNRLDGLALGFEFSNGYYHGVEGGNLIAR